MKQKNKLIGLLMIIAFGYVAFTIYAFVVKQILMYPYPYGNFLFNPGDRFMDFFNVNYMVYERRPYADYGSSYPPFALVIAWLFSRMVDYASYEYPPLEVVDTLPAQISVGVFLSIFTILIGVILHCFIKRSGVVRNPFMQILAIVGLIGTAPYVFMVDRGNYLIITIAVMLAFTYFYEEHEYLSAIFLGIAIALKLYPAYLLLLLLLDKRWKSIGISTVVAGGLSFVSLFLFQGGFVRNVKDFVWSLLAFGGGYEVEYPNVYFCTGLTSLLRMPFMIWNEGRVPEKVPIMLIYVLLGTGLSLWSLWNLRREKLLWKKILILCCLMIFLTPNSYMYNLMYFLPAIILFLLAKVGNKKWLDMCYLVLIGLIMIPKAYYYILPGYLIGIQVVIDGILLLVMVLFYNIVDKEKETC